MLRLPTKQAVQTGAETVAKGADEMAQAAGTAAVKAPVKPTVGKRSSDVVFELMANNMLGGVHTQFGNAFDGTMNAMTGPFKTLTHSMLSSGRGIDDKRWVSEAVYGVMGMFDGVHRYAQYAGRRMKNKLPGQVKEAPVDTMKKVGLNPDTNAASKLDMQHRSWKAEQFGMSPESLQGRTMEFIGSAINAPGSALNFVDLGLKQVTYNRVQWEQAQRLVKRGKQPTHADALMFVRKDPASMRGAVDEAEYYTYTGSPQTPMLKWITSKDTDKIPGLRFVVPFRRAIANIFEQGLEHSPLVFASPTLRKTLFSADPLIADAARTKLVFGTTMMTGMGFLLADNLVGSAPRGKQESSVFRIANGGENILKLGDQSFEFKYMGIYGQYLEQLAYANQWNTNLRSGQLQEDGTRKLDKEYAELMVGSLEHFVNGHWGNNIVEFASVISDSIRSKDPSRLQNFFVRTLGHAIPIHGHAAVINAKQKNNPYATRKETPRDVLTDWGSNSNKELEPSYSWDFKPMLRGKLETDPVMRKRYYGETDDVDDLMAALQVEFTDLPEFMPTDNPNMPGQRSEKVKLKPQDRAFIAKIGREGHNGFPSVREYLQQTVFDRGLWKMYTNGGAKYDFARHTFIQDTYSGYMSQVVQLAKGDTSKDGIAARLHKMQAAQNKYMTKLAGQLR